MRLLSRTLYRSTDYLIIVACFKETFSEPRKRFDFFFQIHNQSHMKSYQAFKEKKKNPLKTYRKSSHDIMFSLTEPLEVVTK